MSMIRCAYALAGLWLALLPPVVMAGQDGCTARGGVGLEGASVQARDAKLNPDGAFSADVERAIGFFDLDGRCRHSAVELNFDVHAERIGSRGEEGIAQSGRGHESVAIVRELYVALNPSGAVFVDIGKKDIRNGQMFFFSPLDVLQNPVGTSSQGYISAEGVSWRDTYREGSVLIQGAWFGTQGSFEAALIPDLANVPAEGISEWTSLQRSNTEDRLYLAFGSNLYEDFNPRVVALLGSENRLGVGVSGFLNDDLILNLEMAVHDRSDVRRINKYALGEFARGVFPSASDVLVEQSRSVYSQFAAGLRHTTASRLDVTIEYFFQEQGYSTSEWDDHYNFLDLSRGYYDSTGLPDFLGYSLILAGEADDMSRRDSLVGQQYLMAHLSQAPKGQYGWAWESSTVVNVDDLSYSANLHLSSQFQRHLKAYLGGSYLGGSGRSEFGRFGEDGVIYAGIRAIW